MCSSITLPDQIGAFSEAQRRDDVTQFACAHCKLPVPAGLVEPLADRQFCCQGCKCVYAILHDLGLERFYRIRESAAPSPARVSGRRFDECDDPAFQANYCRPLPNGLMATEWFLEGVHCAACVWLVEKLPRLQPGVIGATLNLSTSLVEVVWDPSRAPLSRIARVVDSLGYTPHPARDARARAARSREERRFLTRIAVAGACAGNSMLLALALYSGMFGGMQSEYAVFFRWLSMLIGLIALSWSGSIFFRGAWAAIRTRTPHLDLPISIGLGVGALSGIVCTVLNVGDIYFDSLTVLTLLLLVGRWIQHRQQRGAADALELLFALTPTAARLVDGDAVREVPIDAIQSGALLEVRAGDCIPADGVVSIGQSLVDQSLLTGESRPISVEPGTAVFAGTVNLSSVLRIRAVSAGAATRVGKLMQLVEQSAQRRPAIVRFTDRVAGWFVAVVLGLAAATLVAWAPVDAAAGMKNATALLIVTCPCALGLATPLAVTVAIGRGARRRILIKGGDALERLSRPGTILLDKTGTITAGRSRVARWYGDDFVKPMIVALEEHSNHPIAGALVEAFRGTAPIPIADHVIQTLGGGMEGRVGKHRVRIGSTRFVSSDRFAVPPGLDRFERDLASAGLTPIRVAVDGHISACAGIGDGVRADSPSAVRRLKEFGWRVRIVSGDHSDVVANVAEQIGIVPEDACGEVAPEQKLNLVHALRGRDAVVMVGDGVNDAAALGGATVGIAVHGGAEASLAAADIYLNRPGLTPLVELIGAARGMMRTIRRSLAVSLMYNGAAAGLAMAGYINPLVAAILMPVSSFTVIALAFSQRSFAAPRAVAASGGNECL